MNGNKATGAGLAFIFALTSFFFTPSAFADDECTPAAGSGTLTDGVDGVSDPTLNNDDPDHFVCGDNSQDEFTFADGVAYDSDGALLLENTNGGDLGDRNAFGGNGIQLTGNGADDVTFSADRGIESEGLNGALLDVDTDDGDISVTVEVSGGNRAAVAANVNNPANVTHGIRALSNSGDIDIVTTGHVQAESFTQSTPLTGDQSGILAVTGGNISITAHDSNDPDSIGNSQITGRERAIRAISNDGGNVDIITGVGFRILAAGSSSPNDSIGIEARSLGGDGDVYVTNTDGARVTGRIGGNAYGILAQASGMGNVTIDIGGEDGSIVQVDGNDEGTAIRAIVESGDIVLNNDGSIGPGNLSPDGRALHLSVGLDGTATVNNFSMLLAGQSYSDDADVIRNPIIRGDGAGSISINNQGLVNGGVDFVGHAGEMLFDNPGLWRVSGENHTFGSGADLIHNRTGGVIATGAGAGVGDPSLQTTEIDFGDGVDRLHNEGMLLVGEASTISDSILTEINPAETSFLNLDSFDNSGLIVLGGRTDGGAPESPAPLYVARSNIQPNNVLALPGATFTGLEGGRILLDAALHTGASQLNCTDRDAEAFLPGADCLVLSDGTATGATAGVTEVFVEQIVPGAVGAYNPDGMVIVDVSGGDSAQGHFVIAPDSPDFNPATGGIVKDLFTYQILYDADTQQHKLVGLPGAPAWQMPLAVQAAQALSRTATTPVFDRLIGLRDVPADDMEHGVWAQVSQATGERDALQSSSSAFGAGVDFDNGFEQDTLALTLGVDWLHGSADDGLWSVGATFGYVRSELDFDVSTDAIDFDGVTVGLYSGLVAGDFFVNAAVNSAWLKMDHDVPAAELFPEGTILSTDSQTLGLQAETGWTFRLGEAIGIEPLASLSWVRADFDDMNVLADDTVGLPGNTVAFEEEAPTSLRGGLGARFTFDQDLRAVRLTYALTGRVWEEFDGETNVLIRNAGPDALVGDEFDGTFSELVAGVNLSNASGSVSGFLNADGMFHEDYESLGFEVGFRYQW